jgi:alpha-beta hydrolase superfamily lysophospholipase
MVRSLVRWLVAAAGSVLLGLALIGAGLYWHFLRSGPAPAVWHEVRLADFTAGESDAVRTLDDYLALEERLFADLQEQVYAAVPPAERFVINRYFAGSRSDPGIWPVNWNRTFRLAPQGSGPSRGAVLLLHGLTDSPYSLRSIGEHLAARGFEVVGLRLPGHGTAPSGLLSFEIEDMQAAVRLAMRDLRARSGPDRPLLVVGYSNGAALAVDYALAALDDATLPGPAGLVLVSPAIGVSKMAIVGRLKIGLSSVPGFERAAWESIATEFDPYKYTSFSFHAAGETFRLTRTLARGIERRAGGGPLDGFPPVLAFLSTVDSTVKAEAVADALLDHLAPAGHELVLFDVNRYTDVQPLLVSDPGPLTERLRARSQRPYALTVITNASPQSLQVVEQRALAGSGQVEQRELGVAWPPMTFSLSHVALPFPPDDPLYGFEDRERANHVQLGRIEIRGENGVLKVPMWALTRQRSNPFHAYLLERIDGFVDAATAR